MNETIALYVAGMLLTRVAIHYRTDCYEMKYFPRPPLRTHYDAIGTDPCDLYYCKIIRFLWQGDYDSDGYRKFNLDLP